MNPQIMVEATTLAEHFVTTRRRVGGALGKSYPTWQFTQGKDRKVLIETFKIILMASSEIAKRESTAVRKSNLKPMI